jgi:hypothetical protein
MPMKQPNPVLSFALAPSLRLALLLRWPKSLPRRPRNAAKRQNTPDTGLRVRVVANYKALVSEQSSPPAI